ncbi:MAG: Ig-like domain-containing protein [Ignavibacteriaceae bacterium]|nr:MAG: hypothetical protein UZ04_CHB001000634 [Chlorobi bacterium OLB4]MBV6398313.1 hypothetical protein [Ignavibacteria bacterium]MBW7855286.1 Ig-like domain-containing protein [Ignavibacteria bacterium]MCC6886096.1 Ig-like domain-containing protein [Ignavibacteriales bacterium]MEB2329568.1 Ig-like domain-containing protein [Ignavibacteriaceae bacterium]
MKRFLITFLIIVSGCANQLPPPGGPEDTKGPVVLEVSPLPNTTSFHGNKIIIRFDEDVDKRSVQESILITPDTDTKPEFEWDGNEVTFTYPGNLLPDRTYTIVVGTGVKDRIAGNHMDMPFQFAFSTGEKLDKSSVSGTIYAPTLNKIKIFAYLTEYKSENFNPDGLKPDFIAIPGSDGNYNLSNIPGGDYRVISVIDENNNFIFNENLDKVSVSFKKTFVNEDSSIAGVDFNFFEVEDELNSVSYLKTLFPVGTTGLYINIKNSAENLPVGIIFNSYIKNKKLPFDQLRSDLKLFLNGETVESKLVFNPVSDSVIQIFPVQKFEPGQKGKLTFITKETADTINFSVIERDNAGVVEGSVTNKTEFQHRVVIRLMPTTEGLFTITENPEYSGRFRFDLVPEGKYRLFSFIDVDGNGRFNKGSYFPFELSEPFFFYHEILNIRERWEIENVFIRF